MKTSGIQQQTLLVALIPIVVMTLLFGVYLIYVRFSDLERALVERSQLQARHLASLSEFAVFSGDLSSLQQQVQSVLEQPDVMAVTLMGRTGQVLLHQVRSGARSLIPAGLGAEQNVLEDHGHLVLYEPILPSEVALNGLGDDGTMQARKSEALGAVILEVSKQRLKRQKLLMLAINLLVTLLVVMLSAMAALWAARRIARPVQKLEQAVKQIGRGDLALRIPQDFAVDELNHLAAGINGMAAQLHEERRLLEQRIDAATRELRQKKEEAEQASLERAALNDKLQGTLSELESIIDANPDILYVLDTEGRLIKWNRNLERLCGKAGDELAGLHATSLFVEEDRPAVQHWLETLRKEGTASIEAQCLNVQGHGVPFLCNGVALHDPSGKLVGYTGTGRDITERRQVAERMKYLAHYDALTDLPNRILFSDRLQQCFAAARRDHSRFALMFVDLDEFKPVNDNLGHAVGDLVLKEVAHRMQGCVRETDTVARIGGDEFVVLLPNIGEDGDALRVAEKIRHAVAQPMEFVGMCVQVSTSIGIALYPEHGREESALVHHADDAMYEAKLGGRNQVRLYQQG